MPDRLNSMAADQLIYLLVVFVKALPILRVRGLNKHPTASSKVWHSSCSTLCYSMDMKDTSNYDILQKGLLILFEAISFMIFTWWVIKQHWSYHRLALKEGILSLCFRFCDKYETKEIEESQQLRYRQRPWFIYWRSRFFPFSWGYRTEIAQITGKSLLSEIYTEIWNTTILVRIISTSSNMYEMTGDPRRNQLDSTSWYKCSLTAVYLYWSTFLL